MTLQEMGMRFFIVSVCDMKTYYKFIQIGRF